MPKLDSAQPLANQLFPNITGQAVNIAHTFKAGTSHSSGPGLFSGGSLFDIELGLARTREEAPLSPKEPSLSQETPNRRESPAAAKQADTERPEREPSVDDNDDTAPAAAPHNQDTQHDDEYSAKGEHSISESNKAEDDVTTPTAKPADLGKEEPLGTADQLLEKAKQLLEKLEAFRQAYPALANQLQLFFAPLQQSLEQIATQLSELNPNTLITAGQLQGHPHQTLGKIDQLASLFNQLQQQLSSGLTGQLPEGDALTDEIINAAKSLSQANGKAVSDINGIIEAFRQFIAAGKGAQDGNDQLHQLKQLSHSEPLKQINNNQPQSHNIALTDSSVTALNTKSDTTQAQVKLVTAQNQTIANDNRAFTGGDTTGQQQQNFANAQTLAQQHNSNHGSNLARADGTTSGNTSPTQSTGGSAGVNQAGSPLSKEAAQFEQILKQANRGSVSEQVQFQMKAMIKNGQSKMVVKLDPPELGRVEIKMQVGNGGKTDLLINVERPQTLELLQRDARSLTQALSDAGLQTDGGSLNFNLQGENNSSGGDPQHPKNVYPIAEEQFDSEMLSVVSESYNVEIEQGVNIHA